MKQFAVASVLIIASSLALAQGESREAAQQRFALVIGNATYAGSPLKNPVNDARAMAQALERLGFTVIKRENLRAKEIGSTLREFRSRVTAGSVALFFYAGHGLQVKGVNYLPAIDADIDAEDDVPIQSMNLTSVLDIMEESKARVNLVFLDACRNNPFARRFRSASRGLAKVDAPSGTLIAFATRPGSVAADGEGENGLYTEKLLRHMAAANVPIEQMLKRVGSDVKLASKGRQEPWSEGLIEGDFYFRAGPGGNPAVASPPSPAVSQSALELAFWESIKDSKRADEYKLYLEQYPNGHFAPIARSRQAALTPEPARIVPAAPPAVTGAVALRAQSSYPAKDLRHAAFLDVLRQIQSATSGAVSFEALPAGAVAPAFALIDAVGRGTLAAGWISPQYAFGKDSAFALVEGAPFGLEGSAYSSWRFDPNVARIVDGLYRKHGVVALPCGVTSPHGDLWARKPIAKVDDFKGLKLRAVGIQIPLFAKMGAAVNALPGAEVVPALDRGLIDAAVYSDPSTDMMMGFSDASKVYMVAQLSGARGLDLVINAGLWDSLTPASRTGIAAACRSNMDSMFADSKRRTLEAMNEMKKTVRIYKMPETVMAGLKNAWEQTVREESLQNPNFSELFATLKRYDNGAKRPNLTLYGF